MSLCNTEKRLNGRNSDGKCLGSHMPLSGAQWVADRQCLVAAQMNVIMTYSCVLLLAAYSLA
jgi:hypothetical protein